MKRTFICMSFVIAGSLAQAASFDCTKAATPIEKAICSDSQLSDLDGQLMQSYKKSLSNSTDADSLKSEQRAWLANVRNKCQDFACMKQAYSERIAVLDGTTTVTPSNGIAPSSTETAPSASDNQSPQSQAESNTPPIGTSEVTTPQIPTNSNAQAKTAPSEESTPKKTEASIDKPDAGISGLFNGIYTLLVSVFLIGLANPKWILRWDAAPNRKKLIGYFLAVGIPFGILGELTKNEATKKYEAKVRADREAERQAAIAKEKAINAEKAARQNSSDQRRLMSSEDFKMVCTKGGMFAMAYISAKAKNIDPSGIYENIDGGVNEYPASMRPYIKAIWMQGLKSAEKKFDPYIYGGRTEEVGALIAKGCDIALQQKGFIN